MVVRKDIDRIARVRRESPRSDGSLVQRWHLHTVDGTRQRRIQQKPRSPRLADPSIGS